MRSTPSQLAVWGALLVAIAAPLGLPWALRPPVPPPVARAIGPFRPVVRPAPAAPVLTSVNEGPAYPYFRPIQAISRKYRIAPELIAGLVRLESGFDRRCTSPVGAVGLMQVMPDTARTVARQLGWHHYDLYDPETNLEIGTYYLVTLLRMFHGSLPTALSYYNAGRFGVVSRGVYRNRRYIRIVMDNYWDYVRSAPPVQMASRP
jgi:soluble lytic murein transglycosylase-like protein